MKVCRWPDFYYFCAGEEVAVLDCNYSSCSVEPPGGLVVLVPDGPSRRARYIRFYSGRSAADGWMRFLEVNENQAPLLLPLNPTPQDNQAVIALLLLAPTSLTSLFLVAAIPVFF